MFLLRRCRRLYVGPATKRIYASDCRHETPVEGKSQKDTLLKTVVRRCHLAPFCWYDPLAVMFEVVPWNVVAVTLACEVSVLSGSWWNRTAPSFGGWRIIPCRFSLSSSISSILFGSPAVWGVENCSLFLRRYWSGIALALPFSSATLSTSQSSSMERAKNLVSMMMMIAFITINIGLVPLIEGLCAQIFFLDLRLSVVCAQIFCFPFSEGKIC